MILPGVYLPDGSADAGAVVSQVLSDEAELAIPMISVTKRKLRPGT